MHAEVSWLAFPLLSFLATYLIHSTCLMAGTTLFFLCYRNATPRLRSRCWKTAAIAGFVTAPLAMSFSSAVPVVAFPVAEMPQPPQPARQTPLAVERSADEESEAALAIPDVILIEPEDIENTQLEVTLPPQLPHGDDVPIPVDTSALEFSTAAADATAVSTNVATPASASRERLLLTLLTLAAAGLMFGVLRLLSQRFWIHRLYAGSVPLISGPAAEELADLMREQNLRHKVILLSSERNPEPAAFGIWRWRIVLPERAERELPREQLRSLLAHELAHLVRRDTWWLCFGRLLCTAFAYQPLNFLACRQWQRAAEFICDEWAVRRTGNRLALARCLTTVAEWRLERSQLGGAIAATGQRSSLSERIESLVDDRIENQPWSTLRSLALTAIVLAVVIGLISIGPTATVALSVADAGEQPGVEVLAAESGDALNIEFDGETLVLQPVESVDQWPALQAELTALSDELNELQALLDRAQSFPEFAEHTSMLRERARTLDQHIKRLKQLQDHAVHDWKQNPSTESLSQHGR